MLNRIVCLLFCAVISVHGNEEEAKNILKKVRERSNSLMPIEISFKQVTTVYPLFESKASAEEYYKQNNSEEGGRSNLRKLGNVDNEEFIQNQIETNTQIRQIDSELLIKCYDYDHYLHIVNTDYSTGYTLLEPNYLAIYNVAQRSVSIESNRAVGRDYIPMFHYELPLVKLEKEKEIESNIVKEGTCEFFVRDEAGEYKLGVDAKTNLPIYSIFDVKTKTYAYYYEDYEWLNEIYIPRQVVCKVYEIHPLTKNKYVNYKITYRVESCKLSPNFNKNELTFPIQNGVTIHDQRTNKLDVIKLQDNQMMDFKEYVYEMMEKQ